MRESRTYSSVRGAFSNGRPYRVPDFFCGTLRLASMARTYQIFGDIEGKLDVLRVECTRCDRKGRYYAEWASGTHARRVRRLSSITRVPWRKVIGVPGQR